MVDMKFEVGATPVLDFDRAKTFYGGLGWRLDADFGVGSESPVQFTPPGSGCSIQFSRKDATAVGASAPSFYLIVTDIQAARDELVKHGVDVGEVFHYAAGPAPFGGQVSGPAPDHHSYGSYASFRDPDSNGWLLQEVTTRFSGRVDPAATSFGSAADPESALRRAAAAHGEHEKRAGKSDEGWPEWYSAYLAAEQAGAELPL